MRKFYIIMNFLSKIFCVMFYKFLIKIIFILGFLNEINMNENCLRKRY